MEDGFEKKDGNQRKHFEYGNCISIVYRFNG
jgi:hypothetical protein